MRDKERLEEIKNSHLRGIHSLFGTPWVSMPKESFDWLIEQAERVQELEEVLLQNKYDKALYEKKVIEWLELKEENKRYREALEFYADENNYREQELKVIVPPRSIAYKPILHDYGSIARQALDGDEDEENRIIPR